MKEVCFSIFALILILPTILYAQPNPNTLKSIDDYVASIIPEWHIPGCAIVIVYKDSVVHTKSFGYRNIKQKLQVTSDTVFRIGSLTKSFTALSCALLAEKKQLDLDKPIISFLSDFKLYNDELTHNATLRDLLTHRTGLPRYDKITDYNHLTKDELYHRLKYLEPTQPFRSNFQYTNMMYIMAGHIAEKSSGLSWKDNIQKNITAPLDMTSTYFDRAAFEATSNHALPYEFDDKFEEMEDNGEYPNEQNPAGSMSSNILDMAKYVRMLIHGGSFNGKAIIPSNAIVNCFTPYIFTGGLKYPEIFYESYVLGWFINSYKGHTRINHEGNFDGYSASLCIMPVDSFGIAILTNMHQTGFTYVARNYIIDKMLGVKVTDWDTRLHYNVARNESEDSANSGLMKIEKNTTRVKKELSLYTGTFSNPAFGKITITFSKNQLQFDFNGIDTGILAYVHNDTFTADLRYDDDMPFIFSFDGKGTASKLLLPLEHELAHPIEFVRE